MARPARQETVEEPAAGMSGRTAARLAKHVELALNPVDLSLPQFRVLVILEQGSAAASALASTLAVSPPSVTALIDGLVARGLVERQSVTGDRRRVAHVLTDKGKRMLAEADGALRERYQAIVSYLPARDQARAINGLTLWHKAMDAYVEDNICRD